MSKSVIHNQKECYLCKEQGLINEYGLDRHHIIFGPMRTKSEKYGLWVYVCREKHHIYGPEAPHSNREVDLHLKRIAQTKFEELHSHEKWMQEFGKNYLEG